MSPPKETADAAQDKPDNQAEEQGLLQSRSPTKEKAVLSMSDSQITVPANASAS
jgi:hypothetical protein